MIESRRGRPAPPRCLRVSEGVRLVRPPITDSDRLPSAPGGRLGHLGPARPSPRRTTGPVPLLAGGNRTGGRTTLENCSGLEEVMIITTMLWSRRTAHRLPSERLRNPSRTRPEPSGTPLERPEPSRRTRGFRVRRSATLLPGQQNARHAIVALFSALAPAGCRHWQALAGATPWPPMAAPAAPRSPREISHTRRFAGPDGDGRVPNEGLVAGCDPLGMHCSGCLPSSPLSEESELEAAYVLHFHQPGVGRRSALGLPALSGTREERKVESVSDADAAACHAACPVASRFKILLFSPPGQAMDWV